MKTPLDKVNKKINIKDYSLKEIALYFEKFNNYTCIINTEKRQIKFKIYKNSLPHLIGLQHIYNNNYFKGMYGFNKIINEEITYKNILQTLKSSKKKSYTFKNITNRIIFLTMFFNTIEKNTKLKIINKSKIARNSLLNGNYALYKTIPINNKIIFPMLSIKKLKNSINVIETFIIEEDISFLGALKSEKILNIQIIPPKISQNI